MTPPDLSAAAHAVREGRCQAADLLEASLQAADAPACRHAFIRRFDESSRVVARHVDALRRLGCPIPPLAGLAVSIKDLFDVAGHPTTGGSAALADAPAATEDAPAVARLRAAGAALTGHTNLSEFAFSGVGINPAHGTPANAATSGGDALARVPGGSTSGGATTVAAGAAWAALGSDTGGSIRIPAALQGVVGFKNTQRLTPREGCIPLSTTLDTVCAITRSVRDAIRVHEIIAARTVEIAVRPLGSIRLALPVTLMLDDLEPAVARAFQSLVMRLRQAGATIDEIELPELSRLAAANAQGGFAAAESWAWHRTRLAERGDRYDPRVAQRIRRGASMTAADYIDLQRFRSDWIHRVQAAAAPYDAMLSPTVPIVAPALQPLLTDDEAFFAVNARLLRNPSVVNFLDGCALSLPCQDRDSLPVGAMVWGPALSDDRVLAIGLAIESLLAGTAGA